MWEKISNAITELLVGPRVADNLKDWHKAHDKANQSREEVSQIIKDAELIEKAKQKVDEDNKKG